MSFNVDPVKLEIKEEKKESINNSDTKENTQTKVINKNTPSTSIDTKEETKAAETKSRTVYVTKTGEKYHRNGCRYLRRSKIPITLDKAKARGYDACTVCRP